MFDEPGPFLYHLKKLVGTRRCILPLSAFYQVVSWIFYKQTFCLAMFIIPITAVITNCTHICFSEVKIDLF